MADKIGIVNAEESEGEKNERQGYFFKVSLSLFSLALSLSLSSVSLIRAEPTI